MARRKTGEVQPQYLPLKGAWVAAGMNQEDIAAALEVDGSTLSRWLTGRRAAPADLPDRIRQAIKTKQGAA